MAVFFLLLAFLMHEYTIDSFHKNGKNTYRLLQWDYMIDNFNLNTSQKVSSYLADHYPQISQLTHVVYPGSQFLTVDEFSYEEKAILSVDSSFLRVFDFALLTGDRETCLAKPYSMVLTRSLSKKYFGEADPLNKVIYIKDQGYNVTGIMADLDGGSHLKFDVLVSSASYPKPRSGFLYICFNSGSDLGEFTANINRNYRTITASSSKKTIEEPFRLESLKDCYYTFPENYQSNVFLFRDKSSLVVILLVMSVMLCIASFNYVNFSQARIIFRSKEIIIYRLFGANVAEAKVFSLETFFLSAASLIVAVMLAVLMLPTFGTLTGFRVTAEYIFSFPVVALSLVIFIIVTTILGLVVFLLCTKTHSKDLFKGDNRVQPKRIKLLNSFVVLQIAVSIVLAIISISITRQISFVENSPLGFNTMNVIDINLMNLDSIKNTKIFKNEVLKIPGVLSASVCMGTPLDGRGYTNVKFDDEMTELNFINGDLDYLKTLGLEVIKGRGFRTSADSSYVLINEAALKYYRLDRDLQPTDHQAAKNVIGLVKDFHFKSFREKITPVEIHLVDKTEVSPVWSGRILIRTDGTDKLMIEKLQNEWKKVYADVPFEYSFISDTYHNLYEKERNLASLILTGCFVSILITVFGLLGVTFFGAQRRLKEFAIRKVHGATVESILNKSIMEAISWTAVGCVIAIPFSLYFTDAWLSRFSYKAGTPLLLYLAVILAAIVITSLSVVYQTITVARINPINILRHE